MSTETWKWKSRSNKQGCLQQKINKLKSQQEALITEKLVDEIKLKRLQMSMEIWRKVLQIGCHICLLKTMTSVSIYKSSEKPWPSGMTWKYHVSLTNVPAEKVRLLPCIDLQKGKIRQPEIQLATRHNLWTDAWSIQRRSWWQSPAASSHRRNLATQVGKQMW